MLLIFPKESTEAAKNAVELCISRVIPSLFPFFVISTTVCQSKRINGFFSEFKGELKLFGLCGGCLLPIVMGIIGGYPVGAKATALLFKNGGCSKKEAERLLLFCNNAGPAFIVGFVGIYAFKSVKIGAIIYAIHVLSSLLMGITANLFSPIGGSKAVFLPEEHEKNTPISEFLSAVSAGVSAMLNISGFIVFFSVLSNCISLCGINSLLARVIGVDISIIDVFLSGLFEVSGGLSKTTYCEVISPIYLCIATFLLGFGGLSVLFQIISVVADTGLSLRNIIFGKLLHGLFSAFITFFLFYATDGTLSASQVISLCIFSVVLITTVFSLSLRKKHMEKL